MIGLRSVAALATILSVACAAAAPAVEEWHTTLLKRQAPGTPAYACHLACGTAITLSRGADPCTDEAFLTDYADCLSCAGPDNINIWVYYGTTLSAAGTKCGLSVTPVSGAVSSSSTPVAVAVSSTSSASSTAVPTSSAVSFVTSETITSSESSSASSTAAPTTSALTSTSVEASASSSVAASSSIAASTSSAASSTQSAGNSTSTTIPFTGAASSIQGKAAGAFAIVGAAIFAAVL